MKSGAFLLFGLLFFSNLCFAGKPFEGVISYKISLNGNESLDLVPFFPHHLLYKQKAENTRVEIQGGVLEMMMGIMVNNSSANQNFIISPTKKTIYFLETTTIPKSPIQAIKTKKSRKILGFNCSLYLVPKDSNAVIEVWVCDKFLRSTNRLKGMDDLPFSLLENVEGLKGIPLQINYSYQGLTIEMMAESVESLVLSKEEFEIPSGFRQEKFDPTVFQGGLLLEEDE